MIQAGQYIDDPQHEGRSYGVAPTHVVAFSTWPGQGGEEANFGLCRYPAMIEVSDPLRPRVRRKIRMGLGGWTWGSFCKTQYASNVVFAQCTYCKTFALPRRCSFGGGPLAA